MVLEVAQAQGKELRMEDKVDVGVIGQQEAVEQRGRGGEPMAVMVRHGHMDGVTVAVEEHAGLGLEDVDPLGRATIATEPGKAYELSKC